MTLPVISLSRIGPFSETSKQNSDVLVIVSTEKNIGASIVYTSINWTLSCVSDISDFKVKDVRHLKTGRWEVNTISPLANGPRPNGYLALKLERRTLFVIVTKVSPPEEARALNVNPAVIDPCDGHLQATIAFNITDRFD